MPDLPLRKPKPENEAPDWVLPWGLFSEHGKYFKAGINYLVLQGQYDSREAALAAKATFQYYYPSLSFIIRHQSADDVRQFAKGVEVTLPEIPRHPQPRPPRREYTDEELGAGPVGRRYRRDQAGFDYSREADS